MIELLEFIVAGTAMGVATVYLGKEAFFSSTEDAKKKPLHNRPLIGEDRLRLNALMEIVQKETGEDLSTELIHVRSDEAKGVALYQFFYSGRPLPFLRMWYDKHSKIIEKMDLSQLDTRQKEVHEVLEHLKTKIVARHRDKPKMTKPMIESGDVGEKYQELSARMQALLLSEALDEAERNELQQTLEPMLQDVWHHYQTYNGQVKLPFTSKALDIFYHLEKKINVYETSCEQKQHDALHTYFSDMEERAKKLSEE